MKENVLVRFVAQLFGDYCSEWNLSSLELKDSALLPLGHQQNIPAPSQEGVKMGQMLPENLLRP